MKENESIYREIEGRRVCPFALQNGLAKESESS
jgi:hypothetical protein